VKPSGSRFVLRSLTIRQNYAQQKWLATKSKNGILKPTEQLSQEYERRDSHLRQQVHILEQQFSSYDINSTDKYDQHVRCCIVFVQCAFLPGFYLLRLMLPACVLLTCRCADLKR
jgi:hypothetical protein